MDGLSSDVVEQVVVEESKRDHGVGKHKKTRVLAWGCGNDGQLGLGPRYVGHSVHKPVPIPCFVTSGVTITKVSGGSRHVLALDSNGRVYSWGWGQCGQLGLGNLRRCNEPRRIDLGVDSVITHISAGGCHSAMLADAGTLLVCGDNSYGQLGLGDLLVGHHILIPTPVLFQASVLHDGDQIRDVSCGGAHTAAVTRDGAVLTWGRGDSGQLGIGKAWLLSITEPGRLGVRTPRRVDFPEGAGRAVCVAAGAFHTAAVTESGQLYTWGKEDHGMLGLHHGRDLHRPNLVDMPAPVVQVACGGWHTMAIDNTGALHAFGRGEYGRLGLGDDRGRLAPTKVPDVPAVARVSCGGTHTVLRTRDGRVAVAGRGDHGRLGRGTKDTSLALVYVHKPCSSADAEADARKLGTKAAQRHGSGGGDATPPLVGFGTANKSSADDDGNGSAAEGAGSEVELLEGVVWVSAGGTFTVAIQNVPA